jgi:hypothetical protein
MAICRRLPPNRAAEETRTPSVAAGLASEPAGQSGPDLAKPGQIRPNTFFRIMNFYDDYLLLHSKLLRKFSRHQNFVIQISL